jgi:glutamate carboxypeptidase
MNTHTSTHRTLALALTLSVLLAAASLAAQPVDAVLSLAGKERPALIETLKEIVSIETGSRDIEGLDRLARIVAERLKTLGGEVEVVEPGADVYRMQQTAAVGSDTGFTRAREARTTDLQRARHEARGR